MMKTRSCGNRRSSPTRCPGVVRRTVYVTPRRSIIGLPINPMVLRGVGEVTGPVESRLSPPSDTQGGRMRVECPGHR